MYIHLQICRESVGILVCSLFIKMLSYSKLWYAMCMQYCGHCIEYKDKQVSIFHKQSVLVFEMPQVIPSDLQLLLHKVTGLPWFLYHNCQPSSDVPDTLRCLTWHSVMGSWSLCCAHGHMLHSFCAVNRGLNHRANLCAQMMVSCCINCGTRNGYSWLKMFVDFKKW